MGCSSVPLVWMWWSWMQFVVAGAEQDQVVEYASCRRARRRRGGGLRARGSAVQPGYWQWPPERLCSARSCGVGGAACDARVDEVAPARFDREPLVIGLRHDRRDALLDPRLLLAQRTQLPPPPLKQTLPRLIDRPIQHSEHTFASYSRPHHQNVPTPYRNAALLQRVRWASAGRPMGYYEKDRPAFTTPTPYAAERIEASPAGSRRSDQYLVVHQLSNVPSVVAAISLARAFRAARTRSGSRFPRRARRAGCGWAGVAR